MVIAFIRFHGEAKRFLRVHQPIRFGHPEQTAHTRGLLHTLVELGGRLQAILADMSGARPRSTRAGAIINPR
jgi:hypothetical protein